MLSPKDSTGLKTWTGQANALAYFAKVSVQNKSFKSMAHCAIMKVFIFSLQLHNKPVFFQASFFQNTLMSASKARSLPRMEHKKLFPFRLTDKHNTSLKTWQGQANAIAYFAKVSVQHKKSFITMPYCAIMKVFISTMQLQYKLKCFSQPSFFGLA